jgi:hypothetical protein
VSYKANQETSAADEEMLFSRKVSLTLWLGNATGRNYVFAEPDTDCMKILRGV